MRKNSAQSILIVDNIQENLTLLTAILSYDNYIINVCEFGTQALINTNDQPPDLILLNIIMPDINGYEICKRLKSNNKTANTPIIFIGSSQSVDITNAFSAGATDYISQPFIEAEILMRVKNHLKIRKSENELQQKNKELKHEIQKHKNTNEILLKLSTAVEQSPVSVVITNIDGNIEYVNPKFVGVTGYSFDEVVGKHQRILKPKGKVSSEYIKMLESLKLEKEWHGELQNIKKNGEHFWESISISPILNNDGELTHYVTVKEDITQRKKIELERYKNIEHKKLLLEVLQLISVHP